MRKILDKSSSDKERKRNVLILGVILIALMIFSTIGYAFYSSLNQQKSSNQKIDYNGEEFENLGTGWLFKFQEKELFTKFNPYETQNVSVIISKSLIDLSQSTLYFSSEDNNDLSSLAIQEIVSNLNGLVPKVNLACLNENCSEDYPIKSCEDSNIIVLKKVDSGVTRVREEGGCILIYYSSNEEILGSDALIFYLLGI